MSGYKTGVKTEKIIDYLAEKENISSLETILQKETKEWKAASKWKNAGKRVRKKDIDGIFNEAKIRIDGFLGINPSDYNPKLDSGSFFEGSLRFMLLTGGLTVMGAGGLLRGDIAGTIFGAFGLLAGGTGFLTAVGASLFGDSLIAKGAYDPEKDTIVFMRSRRNLTMYTLLHEYTHAVTTPAFREGNDYWCFNEGFSVGNALELMSANKKERANALSFSIPRLETAIKATKKPDEYFEELYDGLEKGILPGKYQPELYGLGYGLFRLAQERHGVQVYKEVYNGNTELLFK